jgi:hypothetical protein
MSSAQGPREAGMQASANAAGRRRHGVLVLFDLKEAAGMSRAMATAQRGAGAPPGMRPLRGRQAPRRRSLAFPPLPDPAARVPRATLRGAPHVVGMRPAANPARRRQRTFRRNDELSEAEA